MSTRALMYLSGTSKRRVRSRIALGMNKENYRTLLFREILQRINQLSPRIADRFLCPENINPKGRNFLFLVYGLKKHYYMFDFLLKILGGYCWDYK